MAAAIAILDLLRKNPNFGTHSFTSRCLFGSPSSAFAAAAITPFAFAAFLRNGESRVSYCDAGAAEVLDGDYISSIRTATENFFQKEGPTYSTKHYDIQLKPLFSAFHWKTLAITSFRSFLLFYLPLLEPSSRVEEDDDDDFLQENVEENRVDLVVPFRKSVKQIARETSVVTTRRILERLAVHYVSQRMAWKLLKDVPKSAMRKAGRKLPTFTYIFSVGRTTCRGHCLGVLASWIVQIGIDVYRFLTSVFNKAKEDDDTVDTKEQILILGKKVHGTTVRCGVSLVLASIGAGIGATLVRPSIGQWIGCAIGDISGPFVVAYCFDKLHLEL